ncbi:RICIN domain-containing protein [Streptomyces sp. HUAS TT20]|uniref:RICIN domain-containing protein n=1 Tax=Streptomyces sp. HUAS TT20 TaxID=3447509 RepID=UPI0021D8457D|nr:RICIN domain-containing protein [Streptomyces sp. HUAS 15-9]UXY31966.1 RICIN domain-containing protein [Streptomyces sp. HUAS 15-9]
MVLKRLAAVGAVVGLAVGLSSTPASAAPVTTAFQNSAGSKACLDFRADYGPYVFSCNLGAYQKWHWDNDYEYTALRQVATKLCLTLRNDQLTMKPCAAADKAALWQISSSTTAGRTIQNSVSHKCLARTANDRVSTAVCTGGTSQRWIVRFV